MYLFDKVFIILIVVVYATRKNNINKPKEGRQWQRSAKRRRPLRKLPKRERQLPRKRRPLARRKDKKIQSNQ